MFWRKDANAQSASGCLLAHFGRFRSPNMIRADHGSRFANDLVEEFLDLTDNPRNRTSA